MVHTEFRVFVISIFYFKRDYSKLWHYGVHAVQNLARFRGLYASIFWLREIYGYLGRYSFWFAASRIVVVYSVIGFTGFTGLYTSGFQLLKTLKDFYDFRAL